MLPPAAAMGICKWARTWVLLSTIGLLSRLLSWMAVKGCCQVALSRDAVTLSVQVCCPGLLSSLLVMVLLSGFAVRACCWGFLSICGAIALLSGFTIKLVINIHYQSSLSICAARACHQRLLSGLLSGYAVHVCCQACCQGFAVRGCCQGLLLQ